MLTGLGETLKKCARNGKGFPDGYGGSLRGTLAESSVDFPLALRAAVALKRIFGYLVSNSLNQQRPAGWAEGILFGVSRDISEIYIVKFLLAGGSRQFFKVWYRPAGLK